MRAMEGGAARLVFVGVVEEAGDEAIVRIHPEFCEALKGIEEYSHLIILYWMHLRDNERDRRTLLVYPKRGTIPILTGVFACRSPSRPNPIGLCVVELVKREGCTLTVKGLDAIEGSPIIDIKPYIPKLDSIPNAHTPKWT
ncbi:MAG: tRNA (N6-threonylcarbamoyladenosine(37)-N6)-methyltransferase TrmO [Candidatus Verstraetearchaeota archaeon]|nr:tRNA (N6-threonylcarbamoyladenosine(37)-N6)-methyltransferase TrmO [Candidatus Verstraetearchaeota archaeon]